MELVKSNGDLTRTDTANGEHYFSSTWTDGVLMLEPCGNGFAQPSGTAHAPSVGTVQAAIAHGARAVQSGKAKRAVLRLTAFSDQWSSEQWAAFSRLNLDLTARFPLAEKHDSPNRLYLIA